MDGLWTEALAGLRERLSSENFDTWLAPVECVSVAGSAVTLKIPNRFFQDWISTHYLDLIIDALNQRASTTVTRVNWVVDEGLQANVPRPNASEAPNTGVVPKLESAASQPPAPSPEVEHRQQTQNGTRSPFAPGVGGSEVRTGNDLNPKYNFTNFVVGPSNQLAHAASMAAASSPGRRYNPLFIYGGVGLGKTHLVNAIGHRIVQDKPGARILYLSAERFTNEFIWSLQNHRINEFRQRYREKCDVLLMDDIQFLAGREQTQEEFFHTFNALYHSDRQIVVTSDVYPQQIAEMEERLISRFQSGMVADVQTPELDTRIAILQKKAESENINLLSDVALFVAQVVKSNVRELEGTLLRLAVKAELLGRSVDLELARETLVHAVPKPEKVTTVEDIQRATCEYFNIRLSDLKSHRRHRAVAFPRMIAMYLSRQRLGTSYPELGDRFGGKDHTTVMSAVRKITGLIEAEDEQCMTAVAAIERKLGF